MVEIAHKTGATTIAHGLNGKGNDQVRFAAIAALDPSLKVVAPVRDGKCTVRKKLSMLRLMGVPVPADPWISYSVDQNLWDVLTSGVLEKSLESSSRRSFWDYQSTRVCAR